MAKESWEQEWDIYVEGCCVCVYCGLQGDTLLVWRQLCLDHVIPQSLGGTDAPLNMAVSCNYCNRTKGDYDPRDGQYVTPPSVEVRWELIERARRYIQDAIDRSYESAGEELQDFNLMMLEIQSRAKLMGTQESPK